MFTEKESDYLKSQRLARIATASADQQPDVAPVGFDFDGEYFYVGGLNLAATMKYRNARVNPKVALVVDDVESLSPMRPRGVKIHGTIDIVRRQGYAGEGEYLRVRPLKKWSWGIEAPAFRDGRPVYNRATASE